MATEAEIIKRVRLELGDLSEPFRASMRGTGNKDDWDLPARNILVDTVSVFRVDPDTNTITNLVADVDYMLDPVNGLLTFATPPAEDALLIAEGNSYGIFSDEEIAHFVHEAAGQHLRGRTVNRRYRDGRGFIKYDRSPMTLEHLPDEENLLVAILATVEALWALATDASLDIDVQTAEGTSLPRGQRWRQLISQIDLLTNKYQDLSLMMGVGLFAPETRDLRRVSRTTGRLVPIFQSREYDETGHPTRKTPPINTTDSDPDGPHSPWFSGGWGF